MRRLFLESTAIAENDYLFEDIYLISNLEQDSDREDIVINLLPSDLPSQMAANVVVVSNTDTTGMGSFSQAVIDANASPTITEINFDANLSGMSINNLPLQDITDSLTINFDVDGDDVGDVDLFFDQNNISFLNLATAGVSLTLDHGNITADVDETQTTDVTTFGNFISVTVDSIVLNNNSNITTSGVDVVNRQPGQLAGDFTNVVNAFGVDNFTFFNQAGASIITTGREVIDATFATNVNIVNDGTLIAADDTIRIGTGTITNSGLIESTGEFDPYGLPDRVPGFVADGIALITNETTDLSDFALPEGPVHIVNTDTGSIIGHRSGIQFFGGGRIDNDGIVAGETTGIFTGVNGSPLPGSFLLNNTGTISNNGATFGLNLDGVATVINAGGLQNVTINNSGVIISENFGIYTLDGAFLNNMSGGQILSDNDGTGDDDVAFYSAHLEDFLVEGFLGNADPFQGFISSQGITIDPTLGTYLLPDGSTLAQNDGSLLPAVLVEDVAIIGLVDIAASQMSGVLTFQTDANGVLFPPTIDVTTLNFGVLTVTFVSGEGFTVSDQDGNPVYDVPVRDFSDYIDNQAGALIDGDVLTGLGDDVLINAGEITGDVDLGMGDDTVVISGGTYGGDVDGGEGTDAISFSGQSSRVVFTSDGVTSTIAGTSFTNFEYYVGTNFDDVFVNSGSVGIGFLGGEGNDRLIGGSGDDFLVGEAGNDNALGGDGNDIISGGAGRDRLFGQGGNDTIVGGLEEDIVYGGDGNDLLFGDEGNDIVFGQDGNDTLHGQDGDDYLRGGDGVDELFGGLDNDRLDGDFGNDRLFGEDGDDVLSGGLGDDLLRGGIGNDRLLGGAGEDVLAGDAGDDTIFASFGDDSLFGASGNDSLFGEAGADVMNGGSGDDFLRGGDGHDTLRGDAGDDRLIGDAGNDALFGGTGSDILIGGAGADSFAFTLGSGQDRVTDFELGVDTIFVDADFGLIGFADLEIVQQGTTTVIRSMPGGTDTLILFNTVAADLTADDFEFESAMVAVSNDNLTDFGDDFTETAKTAQSSGQYQDVMDVESIDYMFEDGFDYFGELV